jgi:Na+/melibiose symporter-like transporter
MEQKTHLSYVQNQFLILLGIPAVGLALVYTLVTTYLPFFIARLSNAAVTGMMIGGEGVFALVVPFIVGCWSDSIQTRIGRRLPFFFGGFLLTSLALVMMPFSRESLVLLGIELFIFYIGYFTMYEAYYAFYPDFVPLEQRGRSQGILGGFRSLGMLIALTGGGYLLHLWKPLPFLLFIFVLFIVTIVLYFTIKPIIKHKSETRDWLSEWELIQENRKIKLWVIANTCWEAAVSVLRVFIVLYFTQAMHLSLAHT